MCGSPVMQLLTAHHINTWRIVQLLQRNAPLLRFYKYCCINHYLCAVVCRVLDKSFSVAFCVCGDPSIPLDDCYI